MQIIDSHCHWLPEEIIANAHFFHKGWGEIEAHAQMMEKSGISSSVLTYPTSDAHLKLGSFSEVAHIFNDNVSRIIRSFPKKFIAAAVLPVDNTRDMLEELKRATQELGFQAISLGSSYNGKYLDDSIFLPVFAAAAKNNIPVFVHAQIVNPIGFERVNDPLLTPVIEYIFDITTCIGRLLVSGILREYPSLKIVFANFGGAIPFLQHRFDATYQMLRGINFVKDLQANPTELLKNIYVDTGGDKIKTNFLLALELLGPKHILWGSDWPAKKDVTGSIAAVRDLEISEEDKSAILGGNLAEILAL